VAEKIFKKLLKTNPTNLDAYFWLGSCLLRLGRYSEAEQVYIKAIDIDSENSEILFAIGENLFMLNKFDEAELLFNKVLATNPDSAEAYAKIGWCRVRRAINKSGNLEEAEQMFKMALELAPGNENIYYNAGEYYFIKATLRRDKNFENAELMYKKMIEINPKSDMAYVKLGMCYAQLENFDEAESMFRMALEINPKNVMASKTLLSFYHDVTNKQADGKIVEATSTPKERYYKYQTRYNYEKLKKMLDARNIQLVAMQYPLQDVNSLKSMLEGPEGMIFVDNNDVFRRAMLTAKYAELFTDYSGGNFGHCTFRGHQILAENVASTILNYILKE